MQSLIKIAFISLLVSACASKGPKEPSNGCVVKTGDGLFSDTVTPGLTQARLESKKCLLGFWLCDAMESRIEADKKITVTFDRTFSSPEQTYGTVKDDTIVRHIPKSGFAGLANKLMQKVAEEQGPIVIDREDLLVRFPTVQGKIINVNGGEKTYQFTPQCTNEQVALGASIIEYKRSL